ncbi:LOW QUALITY PROTEIN: hypothetical protein U9M48_009098 [Paspalum notatum var. saurae]|uniref:Uncharacterized protein n=1 Tax=Paspalum notatum var. saurae TaxID=547442 RepID=A0AAQ3SQ98_PASNO
MAPCLKLCIVSNPRGHFSPWIGLSAQQVTLCIEAGSSGVSLGFHEAKSDTSLFVFHRGANTIYSFSMWMTLCSPPLNNSFFAAPLMHCSENLPLRTSASFTTFWFGRSNGGLLLTHRQYMLDILERVGTCWYDGLQTLFHASDPVKDATDFHSLAGALQYLTFTRPDISYVVQQICLHMHDSREPHLAALKRILGTFARLCTWDSIYGPPLNVILWSTRMLIGSAAPTHASPPQAMLCSSATTSCLGRPSGRTRSLTQVTEAAWLRQLLQELHSPPRRATLVYCDNISAVYMSSNPVQHQCTKHIEIDLHFVWERVSFGDLHVLHVRTSSQAVPPHPVADPTAYRSLAGALQYLTFTRPDITYAVQ